MRCGEKEGRDFDAADLLVVGVGPDGEVYKVEPVMQQNCWRKRKICAVGPGGEAEGGDFDAAHLLVEDDGMRWEWIWVGRQPVETFMYRISAWRGRSLLEVNLCQERNEHS